MAHTGNFLSELKLGQKFTMPSSPFPEVIYTKGRKVAGSNYFRIYWDWEGARKGTVMVGHTYCKTV